MLHADLVLADVLQEDLLQEEKSDVEMDNRILQRETILAKGKQYFDTDLNPNKIEKCFINS